MLTVLYILIVIYHPDRSGIGRTRSPSAPSVRRTGKIGYYNNNYAYRNRADSGCRIAQNVIGGREKVTRATAVFVGK